MPRKQNGDQTDGTADVTSSHRALPQKPQRTRGLFAFVDRRECRLAKGFVRDLGPVVDPVHAGSKGTVRSKSARAWIDGNLLAENRQFR
jgi:hypothetical protein